MKKILIASLIGATACASFAGVAQAEPVDSPTPDNVYVVPENNPQVPTPSSMPTIHVDTEKTSNDPLIQRDTNKDVGSSLKNLTQDNQAIDDGISAAQVWGNIIYTLIGYILGFMTIAIFLINALGLFYIAVPIGFVRTILSGGRYGNSPGLQSAGAAGMGGFGGGFGGGRMGMGFGGGFGGGRMGMGMGGAAAPQSGGGLAEMFKHWQLVPDAAIQAVELAQGGARGGSAMTSPGMMSPMGGGQQVGGSAHPVNPMMYFIKEQTKTMVFLGIAIVLLVLNNVFLRLGIDFGNMLRQGLIWFFSFIIPS